MNLIEIVGISTAVVLAWGGIVVKVAKAHIGRRVEITVEEQIANKVSEASAPLQKQITNGLTHRQERIEDKIDRLIEWLIVDK